MLLSRHAGCRSSSISGIVNRGQSGNRAVSRTPAPSPHSATNRRRRSSHGGAAVAASSTSTSTTTTTTTVAAPPVPPLLPTASPFDPSLETLRPARASGDPRVLVREGFWEWEGHRIRYTRAGFGDDDGVDNRGDGNEASSPSSNDDNNNNNRGPLLVCVHGFGGNADHWRKNVPELAKGGCRVAAIDLLGYGYSSKPDPTTRPEMGSGGEDDDVALSPLPPNQIYSMEAWARQLLAFIKGPCGGGPAFLITNSIGGIAALQAAVYAEEEVKEEEEEESSSSPLSSSASSSSSGNSSEDGTKKQQQRSSSLVAGVQLMDVSLRLLHSSKQPPLARPLVSALQRFLRETPAGELFFSAVAKPQTVSKILKEAYGNPEAVDGELVDAILKPGLEPGAARVFLDFISMSSGPLPETLLSKLKRTPVSVLWGEKDPWEKLEWGRELAAQAAVSEGLAAEWRRGGGGAAGFFAGGGGVGGAVAAAAGSCVEEFEVLPGVGHCPQDEAPELVNPLTLRFVRRHHHK